jgi:hypothetical protein
MATPGHTPESISVLVFEHADDTPPTACSPATRCSSATSAARPARLGRLHRRRPRPPCSTTRCSTSCMGLPDEVRVFPAHGAGSACGKNLSTETAVDDRRAAGHSTTRCQPMSEDEFVAVVTEGQPSAPAYFLFNATSTSRSAPPASSTPRSRRSTSTRSRPRSGRRSRRARRPRRGSSPPATCVGSVSVPADGRMAETAGMVFTPEQPIVVMAPEGQEQEVAMRLARIGFDRVVGYVADPEAYLLAHADQVERASRLTVARGLRAPPGPAARERLNSSTSATPARRPAARSPAPDIPLPSCRGGWVSSTRGARSSSTALGGLALQRRRQACCAPTVSPTCRTSSAATTRGAGPPRERLTRFAAAKPHTRARMP